MKNALRVVLDSNCFTLDHFHHLSESPMLRLCKSGRIVAIYGHVVIEETLKAYSIERKRSDLLDKWLPFMSATATCFCKDFNTLFHEELVQGKGRKTSVFMPWKEFETIVTRFRSIPRDGSWRAWDRTREKRAIEDRKREAQRVISKEIRQEVIDWRQAMRFSPKRHGVSRLDDYLKSELDLAGKEFIRALIRVKDHDAVYSRWSRNKDSYPFFTSFVVSMLYMGHYAMTQLNGKIDLNAQADLNITSHLLHSDVLVTNESGFLRQAFEDLWRPKGKVIFTSGEFANFLKKF